MSEMQLRTDQVLIAEWIQPNARVLDLGCGDGTLLTYLHEQRQITGYGLEIDPDNITACIDRGVPVMQSDVDAGLSDFDDDSFDYVIMTQTLQAVHYPHEVLNEMLRVGREGIVTFPNMGHWRARMQVALRGRMPMTMALPYKWYNSPNIHLCSVRDFEALCEEEGIEVLECTTVDHAHRTSLGMRLLPSLLGEIAIYRFRREAGLG
ncbi:methionine biosynthesis protein MetW [Methylohalomonas lacus]|uniref:Methionine biosynthesis protein MetW n=1 Tax=Methylohalomonas lacus TaxID=398773 RepID=A0AAE3HMN7_9GAMM|nr:methionine biosynthesis protein MetW [Methylohalomonas lacus]